MDIQPDEESQEKFVSSTTNPEILSRMALNDNKAGMEGLDKERINKIIHENSVGSKYYENEKKKDAQVDARIRKLLEQVQKITPDQLNTAHHQADDIIRDLERNRDLSRSIVHIDMDAFYASVEERDNPELKNKPMAVGGIDMLSTSNYAARRYGVRAAMPGFIGKKLCPDLILVPLNFSKYTEVSKQIRELLSYYDSNFMPIGLDEAYLDLTSYLDKRKDMLEVGRTFTTRPCTIEPKDGDASSQQDSIVFGTSVEEVVREIRFKIKQKTKLTASAGIAPNTLLAKVASDMNKPNGQFFLQPSRDKVMEFIKQLPIRKVSGIGKVTEKLLNAIGVKTCQDLYDYRAVIYSIFSQTMSKYCLKISIGIGSCHLDTDSERKSISTERTFRDISDPEEMYKKCKELCEILEHDAKKADVKGLTITLKIKTASFELCTRSRTLFYPVRCKSEVFPIIADLLRLELTAKNERLTLRLIGVGLSKLTKGVCESQQQSIDHFVQRTPSITKTATSAAGLSLEVENLEKNSRFENPATQCDGTSKRGDEISKGNYATINYRLTKKSRNSRDDCTQDRQCPICSSAFADLRSLNDHVDRCLSQSPQGHGTRHGKHTAYLGIKLTNAGASVDSSISGNGVTCPVCNAAFCCKEVTLEKFNVHVDSCLNRKAVMELVKSEANLYRSEKKHGERTSSNGTGPPKKRRKILPKPQCTLDHFFK